MKDGDWEVCDGTGVGPCDARVKNHAWGRIKAEGWFFTRAGLAYCPDHHPEWLVSWRARESRTKQ